MNNHLYLLKLPFIAYKFPLLCFLSAFVITLISIPVVIHYVNKYRFFDVPNGRKVHTAPIPTLGGVAIFAGMAVALSLWFPFSNDITQVAFFFSVTVLFALGIMDDLKDLSARYKFMVQTALAAIIAASGIRITSLDGLFGIEELPVVTQYLLTVLTVVGITNAFNLIDGIDGLAAGLSFMSLIMLGLFLSLSGDTTSGLIAFALAGGTLAFLYFNFSPAKIFMGDTGSLILGFVIAVLCIKLIQANTIADSLLLPHAPVFVLSIVFIPVFDTLRVFAVRIWNGKSPFVGDKTHIHHLLTNQGFSHLFAVRLIGFMHAFILIEAYALKNYFSQEFILLLLFAFMVSSTAILKNLGFIAMKKPSAERANAVKE